jgi:hypothetical protein
MSGSGAAATAVGCGVGELSARLLPARAGTTAATENAFRNSLLFTLSIFIFFGVDSIQ